MQVIKRLKAKLEEVFNPFGSVYGGIDYDRLREIAQEHATSFSRGKYIFDTIPEGSYLQIKFDSGTPSGTYGDITLPSSTNVYYAIKHAYITSDSIVQPQLYITTVSGVEKAMISSPSAGYSYYFEDLPVVQSIRLHATLTQDATTIVSSKLSYDGFLIQITRVV